MLTNTKSTSLFKLSTQFIESSNEYNANKENNPFDINTKLLKEQRKYFEDQGQISDKYLLP